MKQIALLKLKHISSVEQADLIVHTLVNHPSETREYCSFLINRLLKQTRYREFFSSEKSYTNIEKAVFDVNPKVCRKIIEAAAYCCCRRFEEKELIFSPFSVLIL